jgi:hypothetical protein
MLDSKIRLPHVTLLPFAQDWAIDKFNKVPTVVIPFRDIDSESQVDVPFLVSHRRIDGKAHPSGRKVTFPAMLYAELSHVITQPDFVESWGHVELYSLKQMQQLLEDIGKDNKAIVRTNIYHKRFTNGNARNWLSMRLPGNCCFMTSMSKEDRIDFDSPNPKGHLRGFVNIFGFQETWSITSDAIPLIDKFTPEEITNTVLETLRGSFPFLLGRGFRDFIIIDA